MSRIANTTMAISVSIKANSTKLCPLSSRADFNHESNIELAPEDYRYDHFIITQVAMQAMTGSDLVAVKPF